MFENGQLSKDKKQANDSIVRQKTLTAHRVGQKPLTFYPFDYIIVLKGPANSMVQVSKLLKSKRPFRSRTYANLMYNVYDTSRRRASVKRIHFFHELNVRVATRRCQITFRFHHPSFRKTNRLQTITNGSIIVYPSAIVKVIIISLFRNAVLSNFWITIENIRSGR